MLPFIFEMKILKYTFKLPNLKIEDDELIEDGFIEETYTFTLLFKGIGVYEELAHKPLLASLGELGNSDDALENMLSKDFISNLACASYVKIENGKFHNNRSTADEFKKTKAYSYIFKDVHFIEELVKMASECILDDEKAKAKSKTTSSKNQ